MSGRLSGGPRQVIRNREAAVCGGGLASGSRPANRAGSPSGEGSQQMPAKNAQAGSSGFSAEERAAMKAHAAELRAEGRQGAKKADGLQALLESIEKMTPEDRAIAERVHVTVTAAAPGLT